MEQSKKKRTRTQGSTRSKSLWHSPWIAMLLLVPSIFIALHFRRREPVVAAEPTSSVSKSTGFNENPASREEHDLTPQDVQEAHLVAIGNSDSSKSQTDTQSIDVEEQMQTESSQTLAAPPGPVAVEESITDKIDTFPSANTKPKLQIPLEWKTPVGCDFSGFFVEVLGYIVALDKRTPAFHLDIGQCSEDMLTKVGPEEREVLRRLQSKHRHEAVEQTVLVQHMWPRDYQAYGHRQQRPRLLIGRSMCETQVLTKPEAMACARVDEVWVPSAWHVD
eukprot:CAMPEP_0118948510 /NCGR_PEP_ID=MMETSP1169-20130426/47967_1 /TAXON_ID=36882 /ORGANISM="Pyramimonas obovata, Strain CCMP722" /LENGTH=276 /DNA_ID=CAMNT_0006894961 /DNA_START=117 /DNA_END=944 /DNA_ORIENTATION=+